MLRVKVKAHSTDPEFVQAAADLTAAERFLVDRMVDGLQVEPGDFSVAIDEKASWSQVSWRSVALKLLGQMETLRDKVADLVGDTKPINRIFTTLEIPLDGAESEEKRLKDERTVSSVRHTARLFRSGVEIRIS